MKKILKILCSPFFILVLLLGSFMMTIAWIVDDDCKSVKLVKD